MPVRARQIREMLKSSNVHPNVIKILEAFAEDIQEQEAKIVVISELIDMQTNIMTQFMQGADVVMKSAKAAVKAQELPPEVGGVTVGSETVRSQQDE